MINHHLLILKRILAAHNLKHDQSRSGTRDLFNRAHEKVAVQVLAPAPRALGKLLALYKRLFVGVVVPFNDMRGLVVEVGLVIQSFQTAVMHILDFHQRVLDELGIKIYLDIPEEVFQNLDVVHKIPNAASTRSIAPMTPVVNKNVHQKLIPIPKFTKG